jgi:hypothetical protein
MKTYRRALRAWKTESEEADAIAPTPTPNLTVFGPAKDTYATGIIDADGTPIVACESYEIGFLNEELGE